jgi:hypothetical protein
MGLKTFFFTPNPQNMGMVMQETKLGCGKRYKQEKMQETPKVTGVTRVSTQVFCRGSGS